MQAASGTWIGNSNDWATDTNWTGAAFPNGAAEVATFDNSALSLTSQITGTAITVGGITMSTGSPAFTLVLDGTAAAATLTFEGAGLTNNATTTVNFVVTGSAGNPSGVTFNNSASAGTRAIYTLNADGFARFTGTSTGGTASFLANAGSTFDISQLSGAGMSVGLISGAGSFRLGSKKLTIGTNNTSTTVSGVIADGGLGGGVGGSLTKVGTATLTLAGANTFTGGTTLDSGTLIVNNNSALGTGTLTITSASGATTLGSTVNNTTISNTIVLQGDVSVSTAGFGQNFIMNGNVDVGATTRTITGVTLGGQVQFGTGGISGTGGVNFATSFTNQDQYVAFIMNSSNTNTYTGLTTVGNGAFLVLQGTAANGAVQGDVLVTGNGVIDYLGGPGTAQQISDTATVTVNSNGNSASGMAFGGFDLFNAGGGVETIGSLFGSGSVWLSNSTLEVGAGNFTGVITDGTHTDQFNVPLVGGKLTKIGLGTLILSGSSTHTGATTVAGGTLQAGAVNTLSSASAVSVSGGATLDLNNFNQSVGSISGTGTVTLGTATLTTGNSNTSTTFSGSIQGAGGLTKIGTGTTTLSGANTYTGATTVNAGTLVIDTVTNASVLDSASSLVLGGGTIQMKGVAATVQSQVLNGLTVAAGTNFVVVNNNGGTSTTLDLSGAGGLAGITRIGDATVDFSASSGTFGTDAIVRTGQANNASGIIGGWATVNGTSFAANDGTGVIVAYTGYTDIDALGSVIADGTNTNVRINSMGAGGDVMLGAPTTNINTLTQNNGTASTIDTTGGTLRLGVEGAIITTAAGGPLTIGTAPNAGTLTAGGDTSGVAGEIVVGNFSVGNAITINSTITDNGAGVVSLTKTGAGTLTVTGTNTYTGVTTVNGGVMNLNTTGGGAIAGNVVISGGNLVLQQADQIADASTISISSGGLNIGASNETVAGVQLIGGTISGTTGVLTSTTAFDLQQGTVSAILGGTAGLSKTTAGTVILSGVNTYTGATNITGGTLQAGAANVIVNTSAVTVGAGATFNLNNFNQSVGSLAGSGTVTLGSAGLTIGSDDTDTTFSGLIQGTGSLTKVGTGTQTLSGANTYSGGTTLNNGGLIVNNNSALGTGTLTITSAGGPTSLGSTVNNTTLDIPISLQGDVSVSTSGFGGNFILNGNIDVGATTRTITGTTLGGQVQFGAGGISGLGGVTFTTTFTQPDEYVAFIFNDANANSYSGLTTVKDGAFLVFQGATTDGAILGDLQVEGNGVIDYLNGASQQISDNASVTVNSMGNSASGTAFGGFDMYNAQGTETIGQLYGTGTVWLSNSTLEVGSGNFSGVISDGTHGFGFTGGKLTKIGVNTLILSGANTYTGATTIKDGVLQTDAVNTLSAASTIIIDPAGTLELNNFDQIIGTLADGTTGGGVVNLAGATLTVGASNASSAFSGTINGTGGLTKVGAGVFNLKGTNNYTGTTAVNGGALVLDSALIGPVTVDGAEFDINATASVTLGMGVTGVAMNDGGLTNNAGAVTVGDNSTGISAVTDNVIGNTGTITGGATGSVGVLLSGAGNTLINETGGTITATTGILLTNPAGTNTIVNRGTITGTGGIAIDNSVAGGAMNLTNFGTINGAVLFGTAGDTLTFVTGIPTFPADGGDGADMLRLVGTRAGTLDMGQITNFESLVKLGGGNWTLDGTGFFPDGTSIQLGELYVRGTLNSPVAVMHSGVLGGTGLIGGRVTNFGVVNPGTAHGSANAIGKLSISGDYQQVKSGTLVIEVAGKKSGQYDVLAIDGRAQLDGALRIERVGKSPRLKVGERLAFLTASNGVDGKFSDVANPLSTNTMVRPEVVYEKNAVVIAGVQSSYKEFADRQNLTPNQRAVAGAVDEAAFGRNARKDKMVGYLNERTLDKLPKDLDLVAPEEIAAVYRMGVAMADTQARNIQQRTEEIRLTNRRPLRAPTPPVNGAAGAVGNEQVSAKRVVSTEPEDRWGSFFTGSGQVARVGRTDNAREYDMETGGITVGIDYQLMPNLVVGIMAGYANMAAQLVDDGSISANGGKLGVYGTYFKDGFHANAAVTGGFNSYEINRAALGGMARGKTEGQEWSALIGAGYLWGEKAFKLEPTVAVQYTYMEIDAFTERGSLAPLRVASQHEESFRSTLGVKAAYEWNLGHVLVRPELMVAWQHEYGERSFTLDSALASGASGAFTVKDSGLGRDGLLLSGGVSVLWEGGTLMYLRYDGDLLRKEYEAHNLSGGVQLTF